MPIIAGVVAGAWAVWWTYWLLAATHAKRDVNRRAPHLGARLIVAAAVVILVRSNFLHARDAVASPPALIGIGLLLLAAGLALAVWARVHLGRNWGMPMSEKADAELVTTGPYRHVRHPIYSGVILALVGSAAALGVAWLIVAAVLAGYFVYSATVEERTMARRFPATYPAYQRTTKMLVPFLV